MSRDRQKRLATIAGIIAAVAGVGAFGTKLGDLGCNAVAAGVVLKREYVAAQVEQVGAHARIDVKLTRVEADLRYLRRQIDEIHGYMIEGRIPPRMYVDEKEDR